MSVQDHGIGVGADESARIFDRFYRGSNVADRIPGSGLGLAICKGIVEAHGGGIQVQQAAGGGSIFDITIPVPVRDDDPDEDNP